MPMGANAGAGRYRWWKGSQRRAQLRQSLVPAQTEGLVLELKVTEAPFQDVGDVVRRSGLKLGFEFLKWLAGRQRECCGICYKLKGVIDGFALLVL